MTSYLYLMPAVRGRELPAAPSGCPPPDHESARRIRRAFCGSQERTFLPKASGSPPPDIARTALRRGLGVCREQVRRCEHFSREKRVFRSLRLDYMPSAGVLSTNWRMLTTDFFLAAEREREPAAPLPRCRFHHAFFSLEESWCFFLSSTIFTNHSTMFGS